MVYLEKEKEIEWDLRRNEAEADIDGGGSPVQNGEHGSRNKPREHAGGVPVQIVRSRAFSAGRPGQSADRTCTAVHRTESLEVSQRASLPSATARYPAQLAPPSRAAFFRLFRDAHTHTLRAHSTRLVAPTLIGASATRRFFCRFRESAFARTLAKPSSLRLARDLNEQTL